MEWTELKLEYLKELGEAIKVAEDSCLLPDGLMERYRRVCDSIEKDLGIVQPGEASSLKVNVNMDMSAFDELGRKFHGIMDAINKQYPPSNL